MALAQRSRTAKSDAESRKKERGRQKKHNGEIRGEMENKKGMSDSKEEKSNKTARALPVRHCFTSHSTEEENLSYASAFHIALAIYVLVWIMQLNGSAEKTPINLILFFFFLPLSFSFSTPQILSVSVLWHSSALFHFPVSYVKVFSRKSLSHAVFC